MTTDNVMQNVNEWIMVKPTDEGWKQIHAYINDWNKYFKEKCPNSSVRLTVPTPDKDGYLKDQFWCIMRYFKWDAMGAAPFTDLKINIR